MIRLNTDFFNNYLYYEQAYTEFKIADSKKHTKSLEKALKKIKKLERNT